MSAECRFDLVEFVRQPYRDGDRASGLRILINGIDLVELVRLVELPFASAEGSPSIAGAYAGLPPEEVCPPSRHFYGEPSNELLHSRSKVQILGCECGEPGCWPLLCAITVAGEVVRWSGFEQPHRAGRDDRPSWPYDQLGPFEFDRSQYDRALAITASV
ncbi:MAG: hypothetical protein HOW73_37505 [Polyangiaceae bacterium]|nr:hypothetical protein [Polyangiaceae bacterium]